MDTKGGACGVCPSAIAPETLNLNGVHFKAQCMVLDAAAADSKGPIPTLPSCQELLEELDTHGACFFLLALFYTRLSVESGSVTTIQNTLACALLV